MHDDSLIFIQCRSTSQRLPGKAFLNIAGLPSVVLCAKRAMNSGLSIQILTSDEPEDDLLAHLLAQNDIPVFRGSLNNVLERFFQAAQKSGNHKAIVRLTADNLLPDGGFIQECLRQFSASPHRYMTTLWPREDILPYGVSLEIFDTELLQEAYENAGSDFEKEHVTPYMRKNIQKDQLFSFEPFYPNLRCTMDNFEDYLAVSRAFEGEDAVHAGWRDLTEKLHHIRNGQCKIPSQVIQGINLPQACLGTVQLGTEYGIANQTGQPSSSQSAEIMREAQNLGFRLFDTAPVYGDSEKRIGSFLSKTGTETIQVVTKLPSVTNTLSDLNPAAIQNFCELSVLRSCRALQKSSLDYVLLHDFADYQACDGAVWDALKDFRADGLIKRLGVSIYHPENLEILLDDDGVAFVQLPFNLLDDRYERSGIVQKIRDLKAADPDRLIIQARSVYLQGLLIKDVSKMPVLDNFDHAALLGQIDTVVQELGRASREDLCLAYVRAQDWIDTMVLGMETIDQVRDNAALFERPVLSAQECEYVRNNLGPVPDDLLVPSRWFPQEVKK